VIETVLVSFVFVADVGFELGGASGVRFLVLQIHYNYATTGLHALQSYRKRERERERKKFIHHKANNQYYNQNELMWQAAREEIPI